MRNNLFSNFLTYFYGSGIGLIIGVITTVVSTRILSPEDFGKASMFTLAVSIVMIFVIFGTDQAFVRFFYEEASELRGKLLFNIMKLPLILLCLTLFFIIIFQEKVMLFLFGEDNSVVFFVLIISIVFQVIYRFSLLVIRMQQKGHLYSFMEILNKSFNLIFLVILFYVIGDQYEILIYSTGITLVILASVSVLLEKEFWNPFRKVESSAKHSQINILTFSYPLVLTTLITWLFQSFDKFALRQWSDFEELGLYAAAFRIVALLSVVQATFSTFWAPVCYEQFEKYPEDKNFFSKTSKLIGLVMFVIAILTILFKDIIIILLGPEFKEAALIMPFLIFMPVMYTLSETTVIGINFYKKVRWHIVIAGVACIVNIVGNLLLVPLYGAVGAATSTGLSYILFFILRTHLSLKYYRVDYGLKRVYLMIGFIILYALLCTIYTQHIITYIVGSILLLTVGYLYRIDISDLVNLVKKRKKGVK